MKRRPDIISRGPETIPRAGTRAYGDYLAGRRFFMSVLPGQKFPEGAGQKELDRLAVERYHELQAEAAGIATASVTHLELPEPERRLAA